MFSLQDVRSLDKKLSSFSSQDEKQDRKLTFTCCCTIFSSYFITLWCVDSRIINHICTTLKGFQETCKPIKISIFQADSSAAPALALGNISISFGSDRVLILKKRNI